MPKLLIKSGLFLTLAAAVFIAVGFFIFSFCSLLLLAPGFLLYSAGVKSIFANAQKQQHDNSKIIDVTPKPASDIGYKAKAFAKSAVRKLRDFLNKYVD